MKNYSGLLIGATCALLGSTSVYAGDDASNPDRIANGTVSTWIELASDYVFRGESETNDGEIPSAKIAITWTHDSGFYAGVYYANNLFPADTAATDRTNAKINAIVGPYIGMSGSIGDTGMSYNSFLFQYVYPDDGSSNYLEMFNYLTLPEMGGLNLKLEFSPTITDWFGVEDLQSYNFAIHPSVSLPKDITLSATYGLQMFDEPKGQSDLDWNHWNIGVSKEIFGWNVDVRYHDTDIKIGHHDYYGLEHNNNIVDSRVVFGVSRSF